MAVDVVLVANWSRAWAMSHEPVPAGMASMPAMVPYAPLAGLLPTFRMPSVTVHFPE